MALLELQNASKRFGDLRVVDDLSLSVSEGEVLGIIGPNGAGKTTALALIAGELPLSSGRVRFDGRDITRLASYSRSPLGIGRTFQIPRPFPHLTVFENVLVGAAHGSGTAREPAEAAVSALERTDLLDRANTRAGALTLLDLKRLELARAIAGEPRLVLLDESAGGLTEAEVGELLPLVAELKAAGIAVIWIEHVIHALMAIADRVVCVDRGRRLVEGTPDEVLGSSQVQDVYLGQMVS